MSIDFTSSSSQLDQLICTHWDAAMTRGTIFRYDLAGVSTRRLSGRFGFIVQVSTEFSFSLVPRDSCRGLKSVLPLFFQALLR